ncbi:unnamed protein product [Trichogramma brassicae]|uniref:RNA-directed DNA polymerase n=1 Tax=Trichogramma brassicae TaxID=86971 RepID=A0A6H5IC40_9HYME|nr:unnamed protein product [Trichogramma brassicae]
MLDTAGKILERIVCDRLQAYSASPAGLSDQQYGFRRGHSTVDAIQTVVSTAREVLEGERWFGGKIKYCAVVTLDVKSAFSSSRWNDILTALGRIEAPDYLLRMVATYFRDRVLEYSTDDDPETCRVTAGVPKGSVLGQTRHTYTKPNQSISGRQHLSYEATYVIAGVSPLALLAEERARLYRRHQEDARSEECLETLRGWQAPVHKRLMDPAANIEHTLSRAVDGPASISPRPVAHWNKVTIGGFIIMYKKTPKQVCSLRLSFIACFSHRQYSDRAVSQQQFDCLFRARVHSQMQRRTTFLALPRASTRNGRFIYTYRTYIVCSKCFVCIPIGQFFCHLRELTIVHLLMKSSSFDYELICRNTRRNDMARIWSSPSPNPYLKPILKMRTHLLKPKIPFFDENKKKPPLTELLKRRTLKWTAEAQQAFEETKHQFKGPLHLSRPSSEKNFVLQIDASALGMGAVLYQENKDGHCNIIAYASAKFSETERRYHCNEQECFTIIWAIKRFRHYLENAPFTLHTDSRTLTWLHRFKETRDKLLHWSLLLQEFQFTVEHCPGKNNELSDLLSRNPTGTHPDLEDWDRMMPPVSEPSPPLVTPPMLRSFEISRSAISLTKTSRRSVILEHNISCIITVKNTNDNKSKSNHQLEQPQNGGSYSAPRTIEPTPSVPVMTCGFCGSHEHAMMNCKSSRRASKCNDAIGRWIKKRVNYKLTRTRVTRPKVQKTPKNIEASDDITDQSTEKEKGEHGAVVPMTDAQSTAVEIADLQNAAEIESCKESNAEGDDVLADEIQDVEARNEDLQTAAEIESDSGKDENDCESAHNTLTHGDFTTEKMIFECKDQLFMRKDNYVVFVSSDGQPCDEGARQLQKYNMLPKFVDGNPGETWKRTNCNWYQAHHALPQAGTASAPTEARPIGRQSRWKSIEPSAIAKLSRERLRLECTLTALCAAYIANRKDKFNSLPNYNSEAQTLSSEEKDSRLFQPILMLLEANEPLIDEIKAQQQLNSTHTNIAEQCALDLNQRYMIRDEGLWFVDQNSDQWKLSVPESMRQRVLHEFHDLAGQPGEEETTRAISNRFHWPNIPKYVRNYVKLCWICACRKKSKTSATDMRPHQPTEPWEMVAVDLMGPYPITARRKRFILIVIDLFSRWVEAFPIATSDTQKLITLMENEVFGRWGYPHSILSDNGLQFRSTLWQESCIKMQVKYHSTAIYSPRANPTERRNQEIKKGLRLSLMNHQHNQWDLKLPTILYHLRG